MADNKLSDSRLKALKNPAKDTKLSDGGGLHMLVTTKGGRLWRYSYRHDGKQKTVALGRYPEVSLADARAAHKEARERLAQGFDPSARAPTIAAPGANTATEIPTFKHVSHEWLAKKEREGRAPSTLAKLVWARNLLSDLDTLPVADIKPRDVVAVLHRIEAKGQGETARRLRAIASEIFGYAIAMGDVEIDPAARLGKALSPYSATPRPAILDPHEIGALLRAIDGYRPRDPAVKLYLQLLPLLAVRPGELRLAEWTEFAPGAEVWGIPAGRMKMRSPHRVPLSKQALALIARLREITGHGRFLFPGPREPNKRPLSENGAAAALAALGYSSDEMTPHGFRSIFSTLANASGLHRPDVIEAALAHVQDKDRKAYNRTDYLAERIGLMQWYADHLDELRALKAA